MRNTISLLLLAVVISHTYSVYVDLPNKKVDGKETVHTHYKPRRHQYRKELSADEEYVNLRISATKTTDPQSKKRISISEIPSDAGQGLNSSESNKVYETKLTLRPGPDFYADIFKIPISLLQAVSNFLGNHVPYVNSTNLQVVYPSQTGTKPKPTIGSLTILPSLSTSSSQTSPLSETADLSSLPTEAENLSSSILEEEEPSPRN